MQMNNAKMNNAKFIYRTTLMSSMALIVMLICCMVSSDVTLQRK